MTDAERDSLYLAIGKITAEWAAIDLSLDFLVSIIRRYLAELPAPEFPRSLRQKVRLLRAALDTVERLRPFAAEGRAVLDRISTLKHKRHRVAHGIVIETFTHASRYAQGYRLIYSEFQGQDRLTRTDPITMTDLQNTGAAVHDLMAEVLALQVRVMDMVLGELTPRRQAR